MKRVLILLLALAMCLSLCACGERDVTSPGAAGEETADTNNNTTSGDTSADDAETSDDGESSENNDAQSNEGEEEAPNSDNNDSYDVGDLNVDISYGDDMTTTETSEGNMTVVEHGENDRLYIQDVTDIYDPNAADPASFLYDYAYESCVELVTESFGQILEFGGEQVIETSGNELYGYGAHMTCTHNVQVYAFIKLVTVDNGYAVMIGVCEEANMNVFDDVDIG